MTTQCKSPITIGEWCTGCGIYVVLCPENVLVLGAEDKAYALFPDRCTRCKRCETRCSDQAITVLGIDP